MSAIKLWYIPFVVPITMLFGTPQFQVEPSTYDGVAPDHASECLGCRDTRDSRGQGHWVFYLFVPQSAFGGEYHFEARRGNCDITHGWCISVPRGGMASLTPFEATQEIANAVAAGNVEKLAQYASMPFVNLHADRSAMQILSCDGETIAGHVPIGETMLRAIEAAAAELLDLEE